MPYLLVAPVVAVLGAILGYPIYNLVRLSLEKYQLFELIQHHGIYVGLHNFGSVLHDSIFWHTLLRTVVFTAANVGLTMVLGTLNSKRSIAGLTAFKRFFRATQSRSTATLDGSNPFPYTVFSQGRTAANYGPAWYTCCTGKKYAKATKQFVMPSHTRGKPMPGFLGGSDLAVPAQSNSKSQAVAWIAAFTSNASEQALEKKGNIPNATNLLGNSVNERAAARSWFVPQAKHWVDVENGNILKTMLAQILTGRLTVKQAATVASQNIAQTLNES